MAPADTYGRFGAISFGFNIYPITVVACTPFPFPFTAPPQASGSAFREIDVCLTITIIPIPGPGPASIPDRIPRLPPVLLLHHTAKSLTTLVIQFGAPPTTERGQMLDPVSTRDGGAARIFDAVRLIFGGGACVCAGRKAEASPIPKVCQFPLLRAVSFIFYFVHYLHGVPDEQKGNVIGMSRREDVAEFQFWRRTFKSKKGIWVVQASDTLVCLRWMVRSFENDVQAIRGCAGITLRRITFCAERIHIGGKPQVVLGPQEICEMRDSREIDKTSRQSLGKAFHGERFILWLSSQAFLGEHQYDDNSD
ncbi:hypothetical protein B0H13DRAFT_1883407 [Mycena leptocephala]|nr:hypothetical protein B0H13DRAFT_1883407 [Mycena leptocephala]